MSHNDENIFDIADIGKEVVEIAIAVLLVTQILAK
jgi:hypothetical protein